MMGQVAVLGAFMLLALLFRERGGDSFLSPRTRAREPGVSRPRLLLDLVRAFSRRSPLVAALLALAVLAASQAIAALLPVLIVQKLGWSQEDYGQMMGGWPLVLGLAGSVAGGWLADRLGHKRMVALAAVLLAAVWIVFGWASAQWGERPVIYTFACAQELCLGTLSAAMFALLMGVSWPAVAASQFTAYMALMNLGRSLGARLLGPASEMLPTPALFVAFGVAQLAVPLLLLAIDPAQNRRELGDGEAVGPGGVPGPA
jgi:PAT family beta-lactamase induction signal transducer AmpG